MIWRQDVAGDDVSVPLVLPNLLLALLQVEQLCKFPILVLGVFGC